MATERMSDEEFERKVRGGWGRSAADLRLGLGDMIIEARRARRAEHDLQGQLLLVRVELAGVRAEKERLQTEVMRLQLDVEAERARTEMVEQTRDGLQEENARLREALKPFSAQAQLLDGYEGSAPDLLVQMGITADDCKRAAGALGQPQAQENAKPPEQPGQALCLWCGEALPLRTPETFGQIVEHLERCSKHPMRELEQTSRQMAKAIAEADAALGEFASHHPRKDGFHPFPRCVGEALGTLRGRIADLEVERADLRAALSGFVRESDRHEERRLSMPDAVFRPRWWATDHACAECVPGGEIVIAGFRCALHAAKVLLGEKGGQ